VNRIKTFIKKETVLVIAAICALATAFLVPPDGEYPGYIDLRVLCLLFCLMAVVAGFKSAGVFRWLTSRLLGSIRSGKMLGLTLVMLPFFSSMFVTNDVALLIFIPFTIDLLEDLHCRRQIVPVIVLQTVAANLGSMATPVGNPQNLFIYSAYELGMGEFFSVTLPLTLVSFAGLAVCSLFLLPGELPRYEAEKASVSGKKMILHTGLFVICLLTVFRVIPYPITTVIMIAAFLIAERKLLLEVDYMLLLTFVCFFIVSGNLGRLDSVRDFLRQLLERSTLLTSVGTSQIISNVPAAVLLSGFTDQWRELLSGVNIGGLGTPIASLASLITMKLYLRREGSGAGKFTAIFMAANIVGLVLLLAFEMLI